MKGKIFGEALEEARKKSGEPVYAGHDIFALERFDENTKHMIIFDVLTHSSPIGDKGERTRIFLTDIGYQQALDSQKRGDTKIVKHAKVSKGDIFYDRPREQAR